MKYNKKRSERQADLLEEEIPQSVQEAHLEFVIAMMESVMILKDSKVLWLMHGQTYL